jgi:hypothetical protein
VHRPRHQQPTGNDPAARPHRSGRAGRICYRIRDRNRHREFAGFLQVLRWQFPTGRWYVVVDNFSPHLHPTSQAQPERGFVINSQDPRT